MATRTLKKSTRGTPLRHVGDKIPARKPARRHAHGLRAPRPEVEQPPTDRDPQGTRHGKGANWRQVPVSRSDAVAKRAGGRSAR